MLPIFCQNLANNNTFPVRRAKMVIIVPNQDSHTSGTFRNSFRLVIVLIWIMTAIGFATIRILFRKILKSTHPNLTDLTAITSVFFNTLGFSLGTISKAKTNSMAERFLTFVISIFAVLGCLMFSGYLFQQFTKNTSTSNIDSLAELKQMHLPVMVDKVFLNATKKLFG